MTNYIWFLIRLHGRFITTFPTSSVSKVNSVFENTILINSSRLISICFLLELYNKILSESDVLIRNGGDEFIIFIANIDGYKVDHLVESIMKEVRSTKFTAKSKKQIKWKK